LPSGARTDPGVRDSRNYRVMMNIADELLVAAAERNLPQLDEKLYLDVFQVLVRGSKRGHEAARIADHVPRAGHEIPPACELRSCPGRPAGWPRTAQHEPTLRPHHQRSGGEPPARYVAIVLPLGFRARLSGWVPSGKCRETTTGTCR
jgi:hypothetical protein